MFFVFYLLIILIMHYDGVSSSQRLGFGCLTFPCIASWYDTWECKCKCINRTLKRADLGLHLKCQCYWHLLQSNSYVCCLQVSLSRVAQIQIRWSANNFSSFCSKGQWSSASAKKHHVSLVHFSLSLRWCFTFLTVRLSLKIIKIWIKWLLYLVFNLVWHSVNTSYCRWYSFIHSGCVA